MNAFKPGRIDGDQSIVVSLFSSLFVLVVLGFILVPQRLWWGNSQCMGLYKAGTWSCLFRQWWFKL